MENLIERKSIILYNYMGPQECKLPIPPSDMAAVVRLVLSGDEVLMIFGKDGVTYKVDSLPGADRRMMTFLDGFEFVPPGELLDYLANSGEKQSYRDYKEARA